MAKKYQSSAGQPFSLDDLDRISTQYYNTTKNPNQDSSVSDAARSLSSSPSSTQAPAPDAQPGLLDKGWGFLKGAGKYVGNQAKFAVEHPVTAAKNVGEGLISSEKNLSNTVSDTIAANMFTKQNEESRQKMQKLDDQLLAQIRKEKDPVKKKNLIKAYSMGGGQIDTSKEAPSLNKTNAQVAAEVAGVGLDVLTAGGASKGVTAAKEAALKTAAKGVGVGALYGLDQGLQAGQTDAKSLVKSTVTGAAIGGAVPLAISGAGKIAGAIKKGDVKAVDAIEHAAQDHIPTGEAAAKERVIVASEQAKASPNVRPNQNDALGLRNAGETHQAYLERTSPHYKEISQEAQQATAEVSRIKQNRQNIPIKPTELTQIKSALKKAEASGGDTVTAIKNAKSVAVENLDSTLSQLKDTYGDPRFDTSSTITDIRAAIDEHFGTPGELKAMQQYASATKKQARAMEKDYLDYEKMMNRGSKPQLNPGEDIPNPKPKMDEKVQMRREAAGKALSVETKDLTGAKKALTYAAAIPRNAMKKIGGASAQLADLIDAQHETKAMYSGRLNAHLQEAISSLSKQEKSNFGHYVEGRAPVPNEKVAAAVQAWKDIAGQVKGDASRFLPKFNAIEGDAYFPHMLKEGILDNKAQKEKAIKHLIETGQAKSYVEASGLLEDVKKYNTGLKKSNNLERSRVAELPPEMYDQNIERVGTKYINDSAKRLSEVQHYGMKSENVTKLIEQARVEGAPPEYLKRLYDLTINGSDTAPAVRAILDYRRATSLDFSAITNATQSVNTATKFGVVRTLRGMTQALYDAVKGQFGDNLNESKIRAFRSGALEASNVVTEGTSMTKVGRIVMTPFTKIEQFNRIAGNNVAESWTKDIYKKIQAHPDSKALIRQAESIGIDIEKLKRGELTPTDIMRGGRKGVTATQFEVNPIDLPLGWQSNLGKMMSLFGSFSVRQGQFLKNEIIKEAQHGNFMPAVRFLGLMGVVVAPAASKVRDFVQQKPQYTGPEDKIGNVLSKTSQVLGDPFSSRINSAYLAGKTLLNPNKTVLEKTGAVSGLVSPVGAPIVSSSSNSPGILNAFEQSAKIKERNARIDAGELRGEQKTSPFRPFLLTAARDVPFGDTAANKYLLKDNSNTGYVSQLTDALKKGDNNAALDILTKNWPVEEQNAALATAAKYAAEDAKHVENKTVDFYQVYTPVSTERSKVSAQVTSLVKDGRRNEAIRVAETFNNSLPDKFGKFYARYNGAKDEVLDTKINGLKIDVHQKALTGRLR